ncbi:hypothetical protein EMO92_08120 [Bifidobacterium reuteri]|uniref:UDP-N-acetylmuramyl tripeptide synthase n=2 Tax=Bifidobacterium reuteri TaxID=983706 RepID=A0A087CSD8_9BIFI|nr:MULTISPECIES: hypothetical protein [Bifidobacterium]KAA8824866.1 hypothetical protein EMO92_08120 [Bifidobacterium reuteri]KFI86188.1 UDP-N-acetylmuramyl tripeptide synthase [Bifidobacterium reuteri DSM 23975]TPF78330.1 hypothetical protein BW09_04565 [Bifidobacterium sp. UTCIF-1]TPF81249.1 hypothetical protein BW08_01015 [Bifidobacterium sp. UTCIF-24]TPF82030.1 hypothetical protein BW12_07180 [Bifidobacterium sp. UTCIF-3]
MSAVSESVSERMTLGMLSEQYGFEIVPEFATNVTITAICDSLDSVSPGSLFVCGSRVSELGHAAQAGAYAALLPRSFRHQCPDADIPLLFGELDDHVLGSMAVTLAGSPTNALAMFAVSGTDDDEVDANVTQLADFLHMLGNPVAKISAAGSTSMTRALNLTYPLGVLDMQRTLAVCAEDGVAAVIIAMNPATLTNHALESVNVDVLGIEHVAPGEDVSALKTRYAFISDRDLVVTTTSRESDELALESPVGYDPVRAGHMSLAISMVLAAGVRKNNVRSALRVANNLS